MSDFLISDLHISAQPRDQYRLDFLKRLPSLALKLEVKQVYILGDLTQQKDKHQAWLVNNIVDLLVDLSQQIPTTILAGNHDGEVASEIYFQFLEHIPNIDFITEPTVIDRTMLLPHTRDYQRDWDGIDFSDIDRIFAHNTFCGALNENEQEMDGIPLDALPNTPIYSGDVHVPQKLKNLTYIGAPYTINFGDSFEPRAILINDRLHGRHQSIPLDGPQKRVLRTDTAGFWNGKANKGDIVRVMIELLREDYPRWSELCERSHTVCAKRGLIVDSIVPILIADPEREKVVQLKHDAPRNDSQEFGIYCNRNQIDKDTRKVGEELL